MATETAIYSGTYSGKGNFTGATAFGKKLFIHKNQMAGLGLKENELPKFPFYAIASLEKIGQLDSNGNPAMKEDGVTPVQVDRYQALSVFGSKESLTQAFVDNATLSIDIKQAISSAATSAGLTQSAIDSLLAVSL